MEIHWLVLSFVFRLWIGPSKIEWIRDTATIYQSSCHWHSDSVAVCWFWARVDGPFRIANLLLSQMACTFVIWTDAVYSNKIWMNRQHGFLFCYCMLILRKNGGSLTGSKLCVSAIEWTFKNWTDPWYSNNISNFMLLTFRFCCSVLNLNENWRPIQYSEHFALSNCMVLC